MMDHEHDQAILSRLVGWWQGTLLHRTAEDQPFMQMPATSENRWVLGGRFVEMTLRAGTAEDSWSGVVYIGYERSERRHVLVSLEPGDRRVTTRRGEWTPEIDRVVLTSQHSRAVCDIATPGRLKLELCEEVAPGREFVRLRGDYHSAAMPAVTAKPALPGRHRRFVIA